MSNQARIAVFKSQVLALIDTLHFSQPEVIGLGLTLAVANAATSGVTREAMHKALDATFDAADARLPGIIVPEVLN